MIKLYFINRSAKGRRKRFVGKHKTINECMTAVEDYISANNLPNVKCYRRYWLTDNEELVVDYGSHRSFFKLVPTCVTTKGQLKIWIWRNNYE